MKEEYSSSQSGQALVEYALLIVLVAIVVIAVLSLFGVSLAEVYCNVITGIGFRTEYCQDIAQSDNGGGGNDTGGQGGDTGGDGEVTPEEPTPEEPTPTEERTGTIFSDDFSGDLSKWTIISGNKWKISSGKLCNGPGEHQILAIGSEGSDYTVSVDANIKSGQGYGIFFRATDSGGRLNGYVFQYDPGHGNKGQFQFKEYVNGYERDPMAASTPPTGFVWYGVQRHISVHVSGNSFYATVDGAVVLSSQSNSLQSGQAGLRTWGSADVCFDNFTVTIP